ncbi:ubiquinol-cytochrome C reductase hinge protein-domain-containing protein [Zalerion maritima]|uniref:Ubiquinol-cytochrome C reductase hinge protein-domain-containing protein n=1 Tax=Zalerion maritima TaxID=339359 RepID=A0AAD5RH16_9PEZI|nr:ubiquinol-cytochrome C reductase hinge protein-domain-containing protein [Zalerion maritima]
MGIWESITDLVEAVSPFSEVEADALSAQEPEAEETEEEEDEDDGNEEEEEEEEEELEDPKEKFEAECRDSAKCAPVKNHFEECVERVQAQEAEGEAKEDCVEEFFELAHCATKCAAPKLWSVLK